MSLNLEAIVIELDDLLSTESIQDYSGAHNGLQVENNGVIRSISYAVDASLFSIEQAIENKVDLLIVHHGLYWQGVTPLTGVWRKKVKLLLDNNIALYSSHLPLDIHPEYGNNILLAHSIGLVEIGRCLEKFGNKIAVRGTLPKPIEKKEFVKTLEEAISCPVKACLEGEEYINELFIVTGGAGSEIGNIYTQGGRNFLTGEACHWNMVFAEEMQMNFFLGTHYYTEILGVKKVAELMAEKYKLRLPKMELARNFL